MPKKRTLKPKEVEWREVNRQVAMYPPPEVLRQLIAESQRRHRKVGATVLAIVREYFEEQERGNAKFESLSRVRS